MGGLPVTCRVHIRCGDREIYHGRTYRGKGGPLPGGMTELDVPRSILVDVDRIGDYFNIARVVSHKIGQNRADKGLHTAAEVRARLVSASEGEGNYAFPVPRNDDHWYILRLAISEELLETGVELNIYATMAACLMEKSQFVYEREMRTVFQRLFALLELVSFLVNALQHLPKGVSARKMPERRELAQTALRSARIMTQLPLPYRNVTRPERISRLPSRLFSFPYPRKSVMSTPIVVRINSFNDAKTLKSSQSFESYVVMVPSL